MNITVVTASKSGENLKSAPAVMSVITAREIESYGALTLFEVLDRATGIYMLGSSMLSKNQVAMRGQNTEAGTKNVLMLLDGRPIRESSSSGTISSVLSAMPLSRVERLEIVRGPGSVLYGSNAFSGVINIITKKGAAQNVHAKVSYGSYNTLQAVVSGGRKFGELEVAAGVSYLDNTGWDYTARGENDYIRNKANTADSLWLAPKTVKAYEKSLGIDASIAYKGFRLASNYSNARLTGLASTNNWWRNNPNPLAEGPIEYESAAQRLLTDLNYQKEFSSHYSTSISLTHNYFQRRLQRPALLNDKGVSQSNDLIVEWTHFIKPVTDLNIVLGGLAETQIGQIRTYDRQSADNPLGFVRYDVMNPELPLNPNPFYIVPHYNRTNWSTYLQADYKVGKFLKLIAGAQANKIPGQDLDIVPRLGTVLTITESWGAKILYGQAYRAPNSQERTIRVFPAIYGNPNLAPEKIGTLETQVSYAKTNGEISLTYFNSTHSNVIRNSALSDSLIVVNGVSILTPINKGTIRSQGIELEGKAYLSSTITLLGSATYQTMEDQHGNKDITGMPKLMVKAGLNYHAPFGLSLGVFNSYFGKGGNISTPTTRNLNPAVKPYHYMTANLSYKLSNLVRQNSFPETMIGLYVQNVLDEQIYYPETSRRNMNSFPGRPGRAFNIQATVKF